MNEFIWVEKYRPKTIDQTILPKKMKDVFANFVKTGDLQNMMFVGTAGLGKTTVARALCNEMGLDYIVINGSEEGNIDTLRNKIRQFASTISLQGGYKVVILDEADYLNPNSFQPALRGFIEEFSKNCRFILTANFKNRIIEALHSRCAVYEFNVSKKELVPLLVDFHKRCMEILTIEDVKYDAKVVANLITKHAPDWRRILNELQRTAVTGEITEQTIVSTPTKFKELFEFVKAKNFKKMRHWVVNNIDTDSAAIFRGLYDEMFEFVKPMSIPEMILIIARYQYQSAFVADQEINTVACITEIMSEVEFK